MRAHVFSCLHAVMADPLSSYYHNQAFGGTGPYFVASYHGQSGRGIGSIFSSIFRWFAPIVKSGVRSLAKEGLHTGANILSDLATKKADTTPMHIIKTRATEAGKRLQEKFQTGDGIGFKRRHPYICPQSHAKHRRHTPRRKHTNRRGGKRKVSVRDIFHK